LRLVAQRAPDLILLDITMPGMDGTTWQGGSSPIRHRIPISW
jgi:DNA-binding response OmpR family regulator